MKELFLNLINDYGVQILTTIIGGIFTYLGVVAKNLYTKFINTRIKADVAKTVVTAVEQLYNDLSGEEKLERAMIAGSEMLEEKGIHITELELRMLLESAVGEFNKVFEKTQEVETEENIEE